MKPPHHAVLLGAFALATQAHATSVYGIGARSCGEWSQESAQGSQDTKLYRMTWIGGYVSAYNTFYSRTGSVLKFTDFDGAIGWLDNYCGAHPLTLVGDAMVRLMQHLEPPRKKR